MVWDDEVELTGDFLRDDISSPSSPVQRRPPSIISLPFRSRKRSLSFGASDRLPRRPSEENTRPVPFASKINKVHPAATGVAVLEHMEQLDAVEARLHRLGGEGLAEDEEVDVGESSSRPIIIPPSAEPSPTSPTVPTIRSPRSVPARIAASQELVPVEPIAEDDEDGPEMTEEDLAALSKSTSHLEVTASRLHGRWTSAQEERPGFDLFASDIIEPTKPKLGISEVELPTLFLLLFGLTFCFE
jgi:phosphatidylinositol 4-kinase type 2